MAEHGTEPTLRGYLGVLRRRWSWVAALSLVGLGASLGLSLTSANQYTATAQLLVQSAGGVNLGAASSQSLVTETDVQTELQLVTSAQVQSQVRAKLGSVPGVTATEVGQTNVIAVAAVSTDPALAATIANTYANAFVAWSTATEIQSLTATEKQLGAQIDAIGKEIGKLPSSATAQLTALSNQQAVLKGQLAQLEVAGATASTGLELVTPAAVPLTPSSPKPAQDALLGLFAGLALGVGAAFLRDNLDDTVASGEAVEEVSGAPVLASVPLVSAWRKKEALVISSVSDPTSQSAEAYRALRTSLQFAGQERPLRTILVTSPAAGDGKTATVANLGAVFAQVGARVVLISSDLRRPGLSRYFAPSAHAELSEVLSGERSLDEAISPVPGVDGLWALGAWSVAANPAELLASQTMRAVVAELADRFDIVLIDSPPVLPVADALILSRYVDGILLVVAAGQTRRAALRHAADKLAHAGAPIVGAVLNKSTAQNAYGYYGGGYHSRPLPAQPAQPSGGRHGARPAVPSGQPWRPGR
jgi:capsular exopolysaccharide synthesis family protein